MTLCGSCYWHIWVVLLTYTVRVTDICVVLLMYVGHITDTYMRRVTVTCERVLYGVDALASTYIDCGVSERPTQQLSAVPETLKWSKAHVTGMRRGSPYVYTFTSTWSWPSGSMALKASRS